MALKCQLIEKSTVQRERERRLTICNTQIEMLDEVIARLKKVLAGVEVDFCNPDVLEYYFRTDADQELQAKEADEEFTNESYKAKLHDKDPFVDGKAFGDWVIKKKHSTGRKT